MKEVNVTLIIAGTVKAVAVCEREHMHGDSRNDEEERMHIGSAMGQTFHWK